MLIPTMVLLGKIADLYYLMSLHDIIWIENENLMDHLRDINCPSSTKWHIIYIASSVNLRFSELCFTLV